MASGLRLLHLGWKVIQKAGEEDSGGHLVLILALKEARNVRAVLKGFEVRVEKYSNTDHHESRDWLAVLEYPFERRFVLGNQSKCLLLPDLIVNFS